MMKQMAQVVAAIAAQKLYAVPAISVQRVEAHTGACMIPKRRKAAACRKMPAGFKQNMVALRAAVHARLWLVYGQKRYLFFGHCAAS
jgi:hypothetical protein